MSQSGEYITNNQPSIYAIQRPFSIYAIQRPFLTAQLPFAFSTLYERTLCANLCETTPPSMGRRVKVLWGSVSPRICDLPLKMCRLGLGLGTGSAASSSCWRTSRSGSHLWVFGVQGFEFWIQEAGGLLRARVSQQVIDKIWRRRPRERERKESKQKRNNFRR
jgi:hypothetical protein